MHLFWGDTPERIKQNIAEIRSMAKAYGREQEIGFGMRLQVICRENERDAWDAAETLIKDAPERLKQERQTLYVSSEANKRVQELAREHGDLIMPHLWTGITKAGPAPASASSATPSSAPRRCRSSSTPAATRSACPAICTTRKPNASAV